MKLSTNLINVTPVSWFLRTSPCIRGTEWCLYPSVIVSHTRRDHRLNLSTIRRSNSDQQHSMCCGVRQLCHCVQSVRGDHRWPKYLSCKCLLTYNYHHIYDTESHIHVIIHLHSWRSYHALLQTSAVAVSLLRFLAARSSTRRDPSSSPGTVHVGFTVDKVTL